MTAPLLDVGAVIAGLDIGGTKTAAVLVDLDGRVLTRGSVPTPARVGGSAMVDAAADLVERLSAELGVRPATVGVGAAGVIDQRGTVVAASDSFLDWAGTPLADELSSRLCTPVVVNNDVNAFLLGEVAWGAARTSNVLGVMLGTGVGGAIVLDGSLWHGSHGAAGEIGHTPGYSDLLCTCGRVGHLETMAAGRAIGYRYGVVTGRQEHLSAREVSERARAGDMAAAAVFADAGRCLALACVSAAALLDVSSVVVGGSVTKSWDLLEPAMLDTLKTNSPVSGADLPILRGTLGGDAVALGAAAAAAKATTLLNPVH